MKQLIRAQIKACRIRLPPTQLQSEAVVNNLLPLLGGSVAIYYPLKGQISLLRLLQVKGLRLSLPRIQAESKCLAFNQFGWGSTLTSSAFGTKVSNGKLVIPDIVICPMLAFNQDLHRIGYGGGYYDCTFKQLAGVLKIGVALQRWLRTFQADKEDIKLDILVTQTSVRRCK